MPDFDRQLGLDAPCGGIPLFMFGDLCQLPPVMSAGLAAAVMTVTKEKINQMHVEYNKIHGDVKSVLKNKQKKKYPSLICECRVIY
jgi:hypothetical protein